MPRLRHAANRETLILSRIVYDEFYEYLRTFGVIPLYNRQLWSVTFSAFLDGYKIL